MISKFNLSLLVICLHCSVVYANSRKILLDYINTNEEATRVVKTTLVSNNEKYKLYNISFDSLKWMDPSKVDNPIWNHNILIIIPNKVSSGTSFYRVSNGKRNEAIPNKIHPIVEHVSLKNNAVGIEIRNVPNQPIKFKDSPELLVEDGIIAYGWDKYLGSKDRGYVARLPMLKAAYLGFRAARDFLKKQKIEIKDYVAFGESKRGWVVWLLPVVDVAVKAIIPSVIDVLNVQKSMLHHHLVYGAWSPVLKDYEKFDIPRRMFGNEFGTLMDLIDPYKYRELISLPKLVINSANDQFFLPDNSQFYFKDLVGERHMMFLPNSGHQFKLNQNQLDSIATYFALIDQNKSLPQLKWEKDGNTVHIRSNTEVKELRVWQASNPKARDFRLWDDSSPRYKERKIPKKVKEKKYLIKLDKHSKKLFTSTFIEVIYSLEQGEISFTTEAFVN